MTNSALRLLSWVTVREMMAKKIVYLLGLLAIVVAGGGSGAGIYEAIQQKGTIGPAAFQNRIGARLAQGLDLWFGLTILLALVYAAVLFKNDLKPRILHDIMIRPVARWEYLAGKLLGILVFFSGFLGVGVLVALGFAIYWGIPIEGGLFVTGIALALAKLTVFPALSLVLSMMLSPITGGILAYVLFAFRGLAAAQLDTSVAWLEPIAYGVYYVAPAQVEADLLEFAFQGTSLGPDWVLYWSVILENVLYAGVVLFLGTIALRRIDLN